jgi:hypothetical protein
MMMMMMTMTTTTRFRPTSGHRQGKKTTEICPCRPKLVGVHSVFKLISTYFCALVGTIVVCTFSVF